MRPAPTCSGSTMKRSNIVHAKVNVSQNNVNVKEMAFYVSLLRARARIVHARISVTLLTKKVMFNVLVPAIAFIGHVHAKGQTFFVQRIVNANSHLVATYLLMKQS